MLAATQNHASSGLRRHCSTSPIVIDIMALMLCPSVLSAPTLMGYFYACNAILQPPHMMRRVDVVLAATPNHASSGLRRHCSTLSIVIDIMALMLCPSVLSAPTLMGHFYSINAILRPPHMMRRVDVVLAATPNHASTRLRRHCSTLSIAIDKMALILCPSVLSAPTLMGYFYACNAILKPPHTTRR